MRIMIVTPNLDVTRGGAEASLYEVTLHLAKKHQVVVVANTSAMNDLDLPGVTTIVHVDPHRGQSTVLGLRQVSRIFYELRAVARLHNYAKHIEGNLRPDLVISQRPPWPYVSTSTRSLCFVRDLEYVNYFGVPGFGNLPARALRRLVGFVVRRQLRRVDVIVANSAYTKDVLSFVGVKSVVVHPFIRSERRKSNDIQGIRVKSPYVLFLSATLSQHKGAAIILAAARELPHRAFVVTGRDTGALSSTLPKNVTWIPWVWDTTELIEAADMVVVPSQWPETFGRVVVEAQRCGTPVLASFIGALPETVGNAGLLVDPPNSVIAWVEAIETLYRRPQLLESLRALGREHAKLFELAKLLDAVDDLLTDS